MLYGAGINIFAGTVQELDGMDNSYVSSLAIRSDTRSKVLAGTKFYGILRVEDRAYVKAPILVKIDRGGYYDYLGMNSANGLNRHIIVYGPTGSGKSYGFVKPFILKIAQLNESMVIVDPKAEFAEQMALYLKSKGYVVKMFNLLDMENSDAWNCLGEIGDDLDMVQTVAEVIIKNTADNDQKPDFWDKAEKNLLVALIHYVRTLNDPSTGELLPIDSRSVSRYSLDDIFAGCEIELFDEDVRKMLSNAIEQMFYCKELKVGKAILPGNKVRSKLCELTYSMLEGVVAKLHMNTQKIKNKTGYIMSMIYNSLTDDINEVHTDPFLNTMQCDVRCT